MLKSEPGISLQASPDSGRLCQQIQVLAYHPLAAQYVVNILSSHHELRDLLARPPVSDFDLPGQDTSPRLFVLDAYLLPVELSKVTRHLTVRCPGSKFLGLFAARARDDEDLLRMLYLGLDGLVKIAEGFEEELVTAVNVILAGGLWAPRRVLAEYVRQTNWLRSDQLLSRFSLTARENQVLQLALRRLTNKEIAGILRISECTVKFHVYNIFGKLQLDGRQSLPAAIARVSNGDDLRAATSHGHVRETQAGGTGGKPQIPRRASAVEGMAAGELADSGRQV
jgi:DNA-binding NarL/FixJ family response regulator